MTFLTTAGYPLVVVALAAAAAVVVASRRRGARARALGFSVSRLPHASGAVAVTALLLVALAALQPAVLRSAPQRSRDDVQVWFVIDTSNSMLASAGPGRRRRLAQAQHDALVLRRRLENLQVGLAVMTRAVLPLLPPTADADTFAAVDQALVKPNTPESPYEAAPRGVSTGFDNLAAVPELNFYGNAKRKLLVVFSDMETTAFLPVRLQRIYAQSHVALILVRVGSTQDRLWLNGREDLSYRPKHSAARDVARLAAESAGGALFDDGDMSTVARRVHALAGSGPSSMRDAQPRYLLLAPYLLLATLPLLTYLFAFVAGDGRRLFVEALRRPPRLL